MNGQHETEKAEACFPIRKSTLDTIEEISGVLGIPKGEILSRAFESPESIRILKDAAREIKKLSK